MVKKSTIHHFPVGNGDMTLIKIASGGNYHYILVDINIRKTSVDDDEKCDTLAALHALLPKDHLSRPYVDVLLLTHPDEDHIRGFQGYFHTGEPGSYVSPEMNEYGKVFIREMWSSPVVFRRKRKNESLCEDAKAFKTEAKRRATLFRKSNTIGIEGDRIRLIGKDTDGKTDDIMQIVYQTDEVISTINESHLQELKIDILGPLRDNEFEDEDALDKNRSSVITRWSIASHGYTDATNFILLGGDASVEAWEIIWSKYWHFPTKLEYNLMLAPHHCSWHTLSHDSYTNSSNPEVSAHALAALSQAKEGCIILSSSDPIKDNKNDPPNYGAKQYYEHIAIDQKGSFNCLADNIPSGAKAPVLTEYRLTREGPQQIDRSTAAQSKQSIKTRSTATSALFAQTGQAIGHG